MKFYLLIIQNDSTQAVYAYDSYSDALAAFHSELAYRHESRISTTCAILNKYLEILVKERWVAESNPEPDFE